MSAGVWSGARYIGALVAAVVAVACGSSSHTSTAPTPVKCAVAVQASGATFPAAGGSGALNVTTNRECGWSVQSDAGWLTVGAVASGRGNGAVSFSVAANGDPAARAAHLRVEDQQIEIAQQAAPCELQLSSTEESFSPAGGDRSVHVRASSPACTWTAVPNEAWITIATGTEGRGEGDVRIRVAASNGLPRSGTVSIGGRSLKVTQSECAVVVEPLAVSMPAAGGSGGITVRTDASCRWSASSDAGWLAVSGGGAGTGPGEVRFTVAASDGTGRTGSIRVADRQVTVTQGSGCGVSVQPSRVEVGAAGGTETVEISAGTGCGWSVASRADWLSIVSAPEGMGAARVAIAVAQNPGPARSGELRVGDRPILFAQASGCRYAVTPRAIDVVAGGGVASVALTTSADCSWRAASASPWITVRDAAGSGPQQVEFSVAPNFAPPRSATLTVAGETITVTQPSSCQYDVRPLSAAYEATGGMGSVLVVVSGPCSWTTVSRSAWITVVNGQSGSGDGLMQFVVDANTGAARTGHLTVAGRDFVVTQSAAR